MLAAFSPMVQALRLHCVEFFSGFCKGGGAPTSRPGNGRNAPPDERPPHDRTLGKGDVMESGLIAIGLAALAAGLAQARIGSGAVGAIAEKPELAGRSILLVAIPKILVILASPSRP